MNFLLNIIISNIDTINFYVLYCGLMAEKLYFKKKGILFGIILGTALGILASTVDPYTYKLISTISIIFILHIFFNKKLHEAFVLLILILLCLFSIQLLVMIMLMGIPTINKDMTNLLGQTLTLCMAILVYHKISIYKLYVLIQKNTIAKWTFFVLNIIFFYSSIFYFHHNIEYLIPYTIYFVTLLLLVVFAFWNSMLKIEKELKQLQLYQQYYSIIEGVVDDIRARQHSFDNKMMGIASIMNSTEDISYVRMKTQKFFDTITLEPEIKEILQVGNKVIAAFIYGKIKTGKEQQIIITPDIIYENDNNIVPDYILLEILGILIDNAIEASNAKSIIAVYVNINIHLIEIQVKNKHDFIPKNELIKMFQKGYSTKSSKNNQRRGYGLYNLKNIIDKYKGEIIVDNEYIENINYIVIKVRINSNYKH